MEQRLRLFPDLPLNLLDHPNLLDSRGPAEKKPRRSPEGRRPGPSGGGGNRTRVREPIRHGIYVRSSRSGLVPYGFTNNPSRDQPRIRLAPRLATQTHGPPGWPARFVDVRREVLGPGPPGDGLRSITQPGANPSSALEIFPVFYEAPGTSARFRGLPVHASKPCRPHWYIVRSFLFASSASCGDSLTAGKRHGILEARARRLRSSLPISTDCPRGFAGRET